ncbi:MAG TPA: ATP-binding protein [Candidatus Blautia ornithocaccae]|nr:ATP-binding protein [Candidatus Blautia ornithocaccae]
MKVITEAILRDELRASVPETYTVPEGKILSPAAREFLQQNKVKILDGKKVSYQKEKKQDKEEKEDKRPDVKATEVPPMPTVSAEEDKKPRFVDYETGAFYFEKPEHMTHLYGNVLVPKDHKRIYFRGKLDSLETIFVLNQTLLLEMGEDQSLIDDLQDILESLREMMRCDVMDEPFRRDYIIGLNHKELREHSHNPMKFYQIKQMVLPDYTLGKAYALLNQLRAAVRETEVAAASAFHVGKEYLRQDIIEELNRMSSAMHIIMCKYLAGEYSKK